MSINKDQAFIASKKLNEQLFSLTPSAVISLFEIDCQQIALDYGLATNSAIVNYPNSYIFRFHNNVSLIRTSIIWRGNEYIAAPIEATGFEVSVKGTMPTPKLSIAVGDNAVSELTLLKEQIYKVGDLAGAKVTRYRTLLKYIDAENFVSNEIPDEFEPDATVELSREIYFIDRKSNESRTVLEYELASVLDVEGVLLPRRLVLADRCAFSYRGAGCCYEYLMRRTSIHDNAVLPQAAPSVANEKNEKIKDILGIPDIVDRGEYDSNLNYSIGDSVFIEKNELKYYFVAKRETRGNSPPNMAYWIADICSKSVAGCKLRFGSNGAAIPGMTSFNKNYLKFGGFLSANKISS